MRNGSSLVMGVTVAAMSVHGVADVIHVPGDAPTIQAGIDLATDGDEVVLADGAYTGPGNRDISFGGRAITVRSGSGLAIFCVIDCEGLGRAFIFDSGEGVSSRLMNIKVLDGFAETGGGVKCVSTSPSFEGCIFKDCVAAGSGGGLFLFNSEAELTDCVFQSNEAKKGGGLFSGQSSPQLDECTFVENSVGSTDGSENGGAGVYNTNGGRPRFTDCHFERNEGPDLGGAMTNDGCDTIVIGCVFLANAARAGTAVWNDGSSAWFSGCDFIDNTGNTIPFFSNSAVVVFGDSDPVFLDCNFSGNSGGNGTAALRACCEARPSVIGCRFESNDAVGMSTSTSPSYLVAGCLFIDNEIGMSAANSGVVAECVFLGNHSTDRGGGMFVGRNYQAPLIGPWVVNCMFSGNTAATAGGAVSHAMIHAEFVNCSFTGNSAPIGGAVSNYLEGAPTLTNCIAWGNGPDPIANEDDIPETIITVNRSIVEGGWTGPGGDNLDADPLFVDADGPDDVPGTEDDDLRLLPGSPAIDAGDNSVVDPCGPDLDGNERIADDPDTPDTGPLGPPTVDMGAYEFAAPPFCLADTNGDDEVNVDDLVNVIIDWGTGGSANGGDVTGALPGSPPDGIVDVNDLNAVVVTWGPCCD